MLIEPKNKKIGLKYDGIAEEANDHQNLRLSKDFRPIKTTQEMNKSNGSVPRFNLNNEVTGSSNVENTNDINPSVVMRNRRTSENNFASTEASENLQDKVPIGTAFFDYRAKEVDELSFQRGSVVEILDTDREPGWVYAKIGKKEGLIPSEYVRLVGDQLKTIPAQQIKKCEKIGDGACSDVYKGEYNKKEVALKIPRLKESRVKGQLPSPLQLEEEGKIREALRQEALIYARLSHENIVKFYGICYDSPQCLVLELCHGNTLFQLLRKLSYSIESRVIKWAIQIARGMEHLHTRDNALVHADLKADNILIKEKPCICDHTDSLIDHRNHSERKFNGKCPKCGNIHLDDLTMKLTDFNISRAESARRNDFQGSIPWMSPEVVRGDQHTKQSDVYSFGIVIWELFTMEKPFFQLNKMSTMTLVSNYETPPIPDDCPNSLRDLMKSCWNRTPKNRPSFTQMIKMMEEIYNSLKPKTDSTTILYYRNSDRLKIHACETLEKTIEHLSKRIGRQNVYISTELPSHTNYQPGPEIPRSGRNKKDKINKRDIGPPIDFKHLMSVVDNHHNTKNSPCESKERYFIESLSGKYVKGNHANGSIATTLPRIKHPSQTDLSHIHHTTTAPALLAHGQKRNESEGYNDDHLTHVFFGPPIKAAKSNPELAGPSSLSGKSSRHNGVPSLGRSNATRSRKIEPDISASSKITIENEIAGDSGIVEELVGSALVFRDTQERGRNQSDSSLGFGTLPASLRSSSSARGEKSKSKFYVDNEFDDFTLMTPQESPIDMVAKHSTGMSRLLGIFRPNKSSVDTDTDSSMCDRPQLPSCPHTSHLKYEISHLCGLSDPSELHPPVILQREPEIRECQFVISHSRQSNLSENKNGQRTFLKASEDPQWKRRNGGAANSVGTFPLPPPKTGGCAGGVLQIHAQRKMRQSTSNSENDDSIHFNPNNREASSVEVTSNECYEIVRPNSSFVNSNYIPPDPKHNDSPKSSQISPSNSGYSRISSQNTQSTTDLRSVGASAFLETLSAADIAHHRSKSSDTQPHSPSQSRIPKSTNEQLNNYGIIPNSAYVPLVRSSQGTFEIRSMPTSFLPKKSPPLPLPKESPPLPPPRFRRPSNLGQNNLPPASSLTSHSPSGNFRSPSEGCTSSSSHSNRRKANILDMDVVGMTESPTASNRRNTPEFGLLYGNSGSQANFSSANTTPMSPSTDEEIYSEHFISFPNSAYRSRNNANPINMAPPSQRAPPPPIPTENKTPKYLPSKHNQARNRPPF